MLSDVRRLPSTTSSNERLVNSLLQQKLQHDDLQEEGAEEAEVEEVVAGAPQACAATYISGDWSLNMITYLRHSRGFLGV